MLVFFEICHEVVSYYFKMKTLGNDIAYMYSLNLKDWFEGFFQSFKSLKNLSI